MSLAPRYSNTRPRSREIGSSVRSSVCARELAERDDDLRLDDVDLPEQERLARLHFVRLRDCGSAAAGT